MKLNDYLKEQLKDLENDTPTQDVKISELIKTLKIAKAEVEWNYPLDYQIAFDEAIKIIETMDNLLKVLDMAEKMHPYKVIGDADTYSQYNEGWSDAVDYIYSRMLYEE